MAQLLPYISVIKFPKKEKRDNGMSYSDIYVSQVERFLQHPDAIVIDIRDIQSFTAGHIKGAQHIDGPTMGNLIRLRKLNPPVLVYCYHGNSSRNISELIAGFGLSNVSNLVGGWQAWENYQLLSSSNQQVFYILHQQIGLT